ncbi:MAG TPA: hypothetical protein DCP92_12215 [Nitrospiraceae bacterium]|nr:hypothetical protein [Nitrospiraceae bacterium]
MHSGDAQRQWFSEMIEMLRQQWTPGLSWTELAHLTTQLDTMLHRIRRDRNIIPPMCTCPRCGTHKRSRFTGISINATILAAGRFGIAPQTEVKELSKRWTKYRKEQGLDHYGKKTTPTTAS